ncbi:probable G-protein coupled receptor 160 [Brachionichthys hirsutus]|uniref:probable G-protein coupled receptor 160 n=1 Tax=Brachionichthys hirsutus TaxID=412623 RepID=UPI0036052824
MLAIISQWDRESGYQTNPEKYALLVLIKFALDAAVFFSCCRKLSASFLNVCSLSIIMADLVMVFLLTVVCFLGPEESPVSLCFLTANASATFGALPLPMMSLGLVDYCLDDAYLCNQRSFYKYLRNTVLTSLCWTRAVIYSLSTVKAELTELDNMPWRKALVCDVEESGLIAYFTLVLFTASLCAMVPFWSSVPLWLKEADRICGLREEQDPQKSDLLYISANQTKTDVSEDRLEEPARPRPPLWLAITLGFGLFWLPYLTISVIYHVFDVGVPAYISVNIMWLECTNSLLTGLVFWRNSHAQGPYSPYLPKNVCSWSVYWYLSRGIGHHQLPVAVFNPSKVKQTILIYG